MILIQLTSQEPGFMYFVNPRLVHSDSISHSFSPSPEVVTLCIKNRHSGVAVLSRILLQLSKSCFKIQSFSCKVESNRCAKDGGGANSRSRVDTSCILQKILTEYLQPLDLFLSNVDCPSKTQAFQLFLVLDPL